MGAFDDALRAGLQLPNQGAGLMGNPALQQLISPPPVDPTMNQGGEFFSGAPRHSPSGDFMDEIFNQGLMPQLMEAFRQSGNAGQYAGQEFDYLKDSGSPFFQDLGRWSRRGQGGDMTALIHPQLRGQQGPYPR